MARSRRRLRPAPFAIALAASGSIAALQAVERPQVSYADDRPVAASASASNTVPASASASAAYGKPVRKHPLFRDDLPPPEKSEVPKAAEWKTATEIEFDRPPIMGAGCRVLRLRCERSTRDAGAPLALTGRRREVEPKRTEVLAGMSEASRVAPMLPGVADESSARWGQFGHAAANAARAKAPEVTH